MTPTQFIGVDMAKDTFHACFDDTTPSKKFANSNTGITRLFAEIEKQRQRDQEQSNVSAALIGVESTSVFHLLLCMRAKEEGYQIKLINPLITKRHSQTSLRGTKNDPLDAHLIRWCLLQGYGCLFAETPQTLEFKHLVREREFLSRIKNIIKLRQDDILYKEACIGQSVFTANQDILGLIEQKMKETEQYLRQYRQPEQKLLQTIPGVGPLTAAACISEVQDIKRFAHPKKLTAFIGTDPVTKQSGTSLNRPGRISKRGNTILRTRLYNAANVAVLRPNQFQVHFQKKRSQGKPYRVALVATMNKMIRVIYAVWTRGTPYQETR